MVNFQRVHDKYAKQVAPSSPDTACGDRETGAANFPHCASSMRATHQTRNSRMAASHPAFFYGKYQRGPRPAATSDRPAPHDGTGGGGQGRPASAGLERRTTGGPLASASGELNKTIGGAGVSPALNRPWPLSAP